MATLAQNGIALIRGNIKGILNTLFHRKNFHYHLKIRVFRGCEIRVHNGGKLTFGENVKIGKNSTVVCNGGILEIGNNVGISSNDRIVCQDSIHIGSGTILAPNVMIYDHDHEYDKETGVDQKHYTIAPIEIGSNVWIGAQSIILRGTKIGDNCVIGGGSVLKGEYPSGSVILQKRETIYGGIK